MSLEIDRLRGARYGKRSTYSTSAIQPAQAMTEANLAGLSELGWHGHAAHAQIILGRCAVELALPDSQTARRYLQLAREWTARTGEVEMTLRAWELDIRIGIAEADSQATAAALGEGRALASACGFGSFSERFERLARSATAR